MIFSRQVLAVLLVVAAVSVQGQLNFNFDQLLGGTDNNDTDVVSNLIPEWLPQCFEGQTTNGAGSIVGCIQENTMPSCMAGMNLQDMMTNVVQCISGSLEEAVTDLMAELNVDTTTGNGTGEDVVGDAVNGLTTALSKQGDPSSTTSDPMSEIGDFFAQLLGGGGDDDTTGDDQMQEQMQSIFSVAEAFVNTTLQCLDPYAACVNETIQQAVANLNPCINTTLTALVECGQDNSDACLESCNTTDPMDFVQNNPFEGLIMMSLDTCVDIQQNVMDPFCGIVDCCQECVPQAEALMDCLINEQLDQVPAVADATTGETTYCDMACPTAAGRRLGSSNNKKNNKARTLQTTASTNNPGHTTTSSPEPEVCLQFAPGLTGGDGQELSARSGVFLPCAYDSFRKAILSVSSISDADVATADATEEEADGEAKAQGADVPVEAEARDSSSGSNTNNNVEINEAAATTTTTSGSRGHFELAVGLSMVALSAVFV